MSTPSTSSSGGSTDDAGASNDSGSNDAGTTKDAPVTPGGATSLTGTLGALGAVQPTVSSLVISNSGETLIYLSSAPITCQELQVSRWLGATAKGSQVVEIVFRGPATLGTIKVPPGEVNYAAGGKSSAGEVSANSGSITLTKAEVNGVVEGTVDATYAGGGAVQGTFHAEFCANGQGY